MLQSLYLSNETLSALDTQNGLMFSGDPLDDTTKEILNEIIVL